MIRHLIFDFGGVLLDLGNKHTVVPIHLSQIFTISDEQATKIWKENKEKLIIGKETPKDFLTRMNGKLNTAINIQKALKMWGKFNKIEKDQINWELVDYIKRMKNNYKIHMLTDSINVDNGSSELMELITKHFDTIYRSYEIGYSKSSRDSFLYILEENSASPDECVFVDDLQANVNIANEIGMKGIFFASSDQLKKDFISLGISLS